MYSLLGRIFNQPSPFSCEKSPYILSKKRLYHTNWVLTSTDPFFLSQEHYILSKLSHVLSIEPWFMPRSQQSCYLLPAAWPLLLLLALLLVFSAPPPIFLAAPFIMLPDNIGQEGDTGGECSARRRRRIGWLLIQKKQSVNAYLIHNDHMICCLSLG